MSKLKILADENMPLVREYFSEWGELKTMAGRQIRPQDLQGVDLLLVRSVTRVDQELLAKARPRFVGTATIGTDHLDTGLLDELGIAWASAPGSNADSVAEYVVAVTACLRRQGMLKDGGLRAGVVAMGNVGRRVAERLKILGFEVIWHDPPRMEMEDDFFSSPLEDFVNLDLICLHAPLTSSGNHPTYHMIEESFLRRQKAGAVLLSAGRGAVLDFSALHSAGQHLHWVLDVWEPEPNVCPISLQQSLIASPHIAGYATQAKWRGTQMIHQAAAKLLGRSEVQVKPPIERPILDFGSIERGWEEVVGAIYDPFADTRQMKRECMGDNRAEAFDRLRKNYPLRHELSFPILKLKCAKRDREVLMALGMAGLK